MSIDADEERLDRRKRAIAASAFVVLLLLAVVWPAPVVLLNAVTMHAALPIDEVSSLGREAPSWDVVFWCLVGLFVLAMLHSRSDAAKPHWGEVKSIVRRIEWRVRPSWLLANVAGSAILIAWMWRNLDGPVMAWAEALQTPATEDAIRLANRFGGGMNPAMIVFFFLLAGLIYRARHWVEHAVAMAFAGASAGIVVQVIKFLAGRTRPELWLGPFHHARASASSFPSGHTVGAFALAGVLIFGSRSRGLRFVAVVLAVAVAGSRVLAFRHWPSDVLASAAIGLLAAHFFVHSVTQLTAKKEPSV